MIGVSSYAEKAIAAVARNRAALERAESRLASHAAARPGGDDGDALFAWRQTRRELEDRVASDREALTWAEQRAEQAQSEAAEREADKQHMLMEREVAAAEKRVRAIFDLQNKLAGELSWLESHVERVAQHNEGRGKRAFIADAERRVRETPARTLPAEFEDREEWLDVNGNKPSRLYSAADPSERQGLDERTKREIRHAWENFKDNTPAQLYTDRFGELVPRGPNSYSKQTVRIQMKPERFVPAQMPERLATAVQLVDLKGASLWPR